MFQTAAFYPPKKEMFSIVSKRIKKLEDSLGEMLGGERALV
jgi:hypothetical protein